MKKIISLILALVLCLGVAAPAFAADTEFVPSISYKDEPEIDNSEMENEDMGSCLVITSIQAAEDKTTDIYQEERDLLLSVFEQLTNGSMKLPLTGDWVIRELLDVSFKVSGCRENGHDHYEKLLADGTTITIDFDLGVAKDANVKVLTYFEGQWEEIVSVTNLGNGSVRCVFEHFCPVAFCVEADGVDEPAQTGDTLGQNLMLWVVLMAVSMGGIVVLMIRRRKHA